MTLPPDAITALSDVFRLLGENNRLRLVLACMGGRRTVGELCDILAMPQTLASHHLRLLRSGRILRAERRGRYVRYAIDDEHVRAVLINMIAHFTEPHDDHRQGPRPVDRQLVGEEDDGRD